MKKKLLFLLVLLLILSLFSSFTLAKPSKGKGKPPKKHSKKHPHSTSNEQKLMHEIFTLHPEKLNYLTKFDLTAKELNSILYLASISNQPLTKRKMNFIIHNKNNWSKISWHFGISPIIIENEILTFHHPPQIKLPPQGKKEYNYHRGPIRKKVELKNNKYEYKYENKQSKINRKIEITQDKYEYKYKNRRTGIEEKLEVKYPSYKYKYHYRNRKSGKQIKEEGIGRPITPEIIHQKLKRKKEEKTNFHLSIKINIEF